MSSTKIDRRSKTSMFLIYHQPKDPEKKVQVCGIAKTELEALELCRNSTFYDYKRDGQYHYLRLPTNVSRIEDLVHVNLDGTADPPEYNLFDPEVPK